MTERTKQLDINSTYNGRTDNYVITLFDDGYRIYYRLISTTNPDICLYYEKSCWAEYKQCDSPFFAALIADELMKEHRKEPGRAEVEPVDCSHKIKDLENHLSDLRGALNHHTRVERILLASGLISDEKMEMVYKLAEKMP